MKGRATAWAIEYRISRQSSEARHDGWGTLDPLAHERRVALGTQMTEAHIESIVSGNDLCDVPVDLSINPYRGCERLR
ncbi:MAG: radical SAM protein, partial [Bacteriovorax sp.]|nr:radical SAM protein [Rhizobacter sp.]